jgi:hypothetical protein
MYSLRERWDDAATWYQRVMQDWPASDEAAAAGEALAQIPASGGALSQSPGSEEGP